MAVDEEVIADNGTVRFVVHHTVLIGAGFYSNGHKSPAFHLPSVRLGSPNPDPINIKCNFPVPFLRVGLERLFKGILS